tara:strand:+ start:7333 stop:7794 length:462 start_codon:yes stop_codon:yes gene_type:complete
MALPIFMQVLSAVGTVASVMGTMAAADAAKADADRRAREIEEDRKRNAIKYLQMHNDRTDQYLEDTNINEANLFGGTGRDTGDQSLGAFFEKQKAKKDVDVKRMDRQALFTDDKYRRDAIGTRQAGEERRKYLYFKAVSTGIQGYFNYQKFKS